MSSTERLMITSVVLVAFLAALVALLMWHDSPATAQNALAAPGTTITVNTAADESNADGDCSLREAIKAANSNTAVDACATGKVGARDLIRFSLGQSATIILNRTLPPSPMRRGSPSPGAGRRSP